MTRPDAHFISIEIPVQWGDMDAAQHVNNTIYLRWTESARIAMFQKMTGDHASFKGVIPILGWQDCKYIFPVTYPDTVVVSLDVVKVEIQKIHCVVNMHSKKFDKIVAVSKCVLVPFDMQKQKKVTLPETWKQAFTKFYGIALISNL